MTTFSPNLHLVETTDDVLAFKTWLAQSRPVLGCDTETGGLDYFRYPLRMVQFGDLNDGWAIPMQWSGLVEEVFANYDGRYAFHNVSFDALFMERHLGIKLPWHKFDDTRIMAHLVDAESSTALKSLSARYIHPRTALGQEKLGALMRKEKWTWETVPVTHPEYWTYAALDPVLTAQLWVHFQDQMTTVYKDVYELEITCARILSDMKHKGARIDVDYTRQKQEELNSFVEETHAWVENTYGVRAGSNKQVTDKLLELGVELQHKTKTGAWSLDKEVLGEIDHPLAQSVLNARKAQKIKSSYMDNFLKMIDEDDLVHATTNQLGARTGRMSVTSPALQTLPRGPLVRNCFIPREGNVLVTADFDQIEMRLLAHLAKEQDMINAIMSGDLHTETAKLVYNDPTIDKHDPRRQVAKNAGFAKVYGAGVEQFSKTAGITEQQARDFLNGYDTRFPGVRAFQNQVETIAKARWQQEGLAYVTTPIGRKQCANPNKMYKLVNYLIQGTAADVLKQRLVEMDLAGLDEYMLLPIHDEIIFDVPKEDLNDVVQTIESSMPDRDNWAVPLTIEITAPLARWGEKYQ